MKCPQCHSKNVQAQGHKTSQNTVTVTICNKCGYVKGVKV